jgi:hypothetical protein
MAFGENMAAAVAATPAYGRGQGRLVERMACAICFEQVENGRIPA